MALSKGIAGANTEDIFRFNYQTRYYANKPSTLNNIYS